jgi:succinyl-diaminopimelate desuccinylase
VFSESIELARELVRIDTVNPPGNELRAARLLADRLAPLGVRIETYELSPGRVSLVARYRENECRQALCFSGHLDTVPLGNVAWSRSPLGGEIADGKLWGRGSSDMKGGVAAMVVAFERLCERGGQYPITLALTAAEETGCQGARTLLGRLGRIGALVIGEPTNGEMAIAHKGALWLRLKTRGIAAHASKPHLGDNAIERMLRTLSAARHLSFRVNSHHLVGEPTLSIGTIAGGSATNIVPDMCEATIDIRIVPGMDIAHVKEDIKNLVGCDTEIQQILGLPAVETVAADPWLRQVGSLAETIFGASTGPASASFFTDASVLVPALGQPPTAIIGPGNPALAHQVDEWCSLASIDRATTLYEEIGVTWQQFSKTTDAMSEGT